MFNSIISFSLENKLLVGIGVLTLIIMGLFSAAQIPLDAVPDITNNQVQIVSTAPTLAPEEVEQLITYPLEASMTNIPNVVEVRSISRYGLSVITIVFEEFVDLMLARQFVQEQLNIASAELPSGVEPELMPITTGLGEIYQYVLTVDKANAHNYDATKLRTIQDWIVKRQLNGTKGIIEVSSFGGYLKQYEVAVDPLLLKSYGLSLQEVIFALNQNNENSGGSYIENENYSFYIRTEGKVSSLEDIGSISIPNKNNSQIRISDVAKVVIGSAKRYGAMTMDGKGEVVGGITLMLKGANSSEALKNVKDRIEVIKNSLPEGVSIYPYLDRSKLIDKTINTVKTNLIEGGLIVIFVLLLLLGNFRAGLIVASVIPLSMLFALIMMNYFGISANLMSLGAIDFGIVIDGAVIIVESLLHTLSLYYIGQKLTQEKIDEIVKTSTSKIYRSAAFGVLIILVVFIPILTLEGTEGKTFRPMAQTVGFAIIGSLILSLTYVPVMASLFLNKHIQDKKTFADKIMFFLKRLYQPTIHFSLRNAYLTIFAGILILVFSVILFSRMGAEFIPTLEEGDIAMQQSIKPGSSLKESIHTSTTAEKIILENFPEVEHVVSKIGTAEVPTDPMAIEDADIMIILKDKEEWTSADNREDLMAMMKEKLAPITWASFEFTQPIQLRFNELMTGAKSDIAIKLFGEDVEKLKSKADEIAVIISKISGAGDVKVDQTDGLQQLSVQYDRNRLAQYGIQISDVNQVIRAAYAGEQVGNIFEEERKFDFVVRIAPEYRQELDLNRLTITTNQGKQIPLSEVATVIQKESPMLISREQARRFINIGVNVRNRDIASLVEEIKMILDNQLKLPPGYEIQYGGQFENLENAKRRLLIAVPIALGLILLLLYLAFKKLTDALIIFIAVPLSAIGGILALQLRGMPFSISSGIGFIALFGISVLNGIVLLSAIKQLKQEDFNNLKDLISHACITRLRPVLMTALVAAFGFLPMALSTGSGAEVQRPLASVVIGGLISSTLLTLLILPTLYFLIYNKKWMQKSTLILVLFLASSFAMNGQTLKNFDEVLDYALANHPILKNSELAIEKEVLNKKSIGQWSPIALSYEGGQINYNGYDHSFGVNQSLSHLFGKKDQEKVVDRKIAELKNDKILLANELKFTLKSTYEEWAYWSSKRQLMDSINLLFQLLEPNINLQFQAGEIEAIDLDLYKNEQTKYRQELRNLIEKETSILGQLKMLAFIEEEATIVSPSLEIMTYNQSEINLDNSLYLSAFQLKKETLKQELLTFERQSKKPGLSIGYFLQSLEKDFAFQGFSIGVQIPLDKRQLKVKKEQSIIQEAQIENKKKLVLQQYQQRINILMFSINLLQESIDEYNKTTLPIQENIKRISTLQFKQGAIDFLKFSQIQEKLLETKSTYFDQLKKQNEKVLELMYLTQKIN